MAVSLEKKTDAENRAKETYRRLMALRDSLNPDLSNNEWTRKAKVSTSFFTNMQGKSKPASEPSVGNLRSVLKVMGVSLPEFFLAEAGGRVVRAPTQQALEEALADALAADLPRRQDRRVAYLVSAVRTLLGLPEHLEANRHSAGETGQDDRATIVQAQSATRRA